MILTVPVLEQGEINNCLLTCSSTASQANSDTEYPAILEITITTVTCECIHRLVRGQPGPCGKDHPEPWPE